MNRKKLLLFGFVGLIIISLGFLGNNYRNSTTEIEITPPENNYVEFYKNLPELGATGYDAKKLLFKVDKPEKRKIKKDSYVYVIKSNNPDYVEQAYTIGVDKKTSINPEAKYSEQKLKVLATEAQPEIITYLNNNFKYSMTQYSVSKVISIGNGSWFGVLLTSLDPSQNSMVAVFQSIDGKIEQVTDTPDIVLSTAVYPDIPSEVIVATNKLGLNLDR